MASVVRYVDTAATVGGNGLSQAHTNDGSGNRAYASLSEWEAAEQTDLVAAGDTHTVYCAGGLDNVGQVSLAGWTTDATNFVTIAGDPTAPDGDGVNPTGIFSTSYYYLDPGTSANGQSGLEITEDYTVLKDIQIAMTSSHTNVKLLRITASNCEALNTIFHSVFSVSTSSRCFELQNTGFLCEGCTLNGTGANLGRGVFINSSTTSATFKNSVITGYANGIQILSALTGITLTVGNCAVFDNSSNDYTTGSTITLTNDYNADDDNQIRGTNGVDISPGGTESDGWTAAFTDYANDDFTLKTGSSLIGAGTNTYTPGQDDMIGTAWLDPPSIGAFEVVSGGIVLLRRRLEDHA